MISRYLVENNQEDHVILDLERTAETIIIKSIFKKLVGNYTLYEREEENKIYEKISNVKFLISPHLTMIIIIIYPLLILNKTILLDVY